MSSKAKTTTTKPDGIPALTPKLRFPEFRDAAGWKEQTLSFACQMQAGKFVSASEIKEQNAQGLYPCYGGNGLRGYTATFTHSGKYSLIGRQGALCGNVKIGFGQFHATEHAVVVTPKNGIKGDWLFYLLDLLNLNRFATGQAQPGLSVDVLQKLPIAIPNQEPEQQKIAECLSSVDELMAAQVRKLDALKTHKKGLMQQLFPREGETQPRLRFPEFQNAGEWDADELAKVADFVNEKVPLERVSLENYVSTENILPDYGGVTRASKLPTTGSVTRFRSNDTLVSNIRPYLKKVWVADNEGGASNDVIVIRAKQRLHAHYLSWLLKNDAFIDYVMTGAKGVKMPRGDIGSIKVYPTHYPTKPEQQRIADCLTSLDDLIAAQTQKLDALKTHKKGLMQQLFPSAQAVEA